MQELDEKIYKDKEERKNWRVLQKDCKRTITTKFGDVTYQRRYNEDKENGEKAYLADRAAGIQKYERIYGALKAEITDLSTMMPYEKSTQEIKRDGGHISRQTVINTLRKIDEIKTYGGSAYYIHYQNGKSGIVKLVYVHEGKRIATKDRNELINPKYFSGVYDGERVEKLWEEVWEYIYKSI